jgi:prepilin peptidase CpaA
MTGNLTNALVAVLAALLIVAAADDLRRRIIPNWLNAAIALAAIPFWFVSGLSFWPDIAVQIGVAAFLFGLFALAFHFGAMGGGDVKLIAALALWLPPAATLKLLVIMSFAGGVLTLIMIAAHRARQAEGRPEIPYGVAIAFGGFWLIGERYLYQFG